MSTKAISLGFAGAIAVVGCAGLLFRALSQPQDRATGGSLEQARAVAERFLATAGVPTPSAEVLIREHRWSQRGSVLPDVWAVIWNGKATVEVSMDTMSAVSFTNDWRILEQVRHWNRTGRSIFRNEEDARRYLTNLARAVGVPEAARLEGFSYYGDDTPDRGDANRAGSAAASFRLSAHGYPFVTPGGPGAMIEVDPQDGMLVRYWASYDHVAIPDAATPPKLISAEAEKLGIGAYLQHTRPSLRRANAPTRALLGWVAPNQWYGSNHRSAHDRPQRVRLAWVVYFGSEAVFVDPYDGEVLGGLAMKGGSKTSSARPADK